jgi:hypothetical protein
MLVSVAHARGWLSEPSGGERDGRSANLPTAVRVARDVRNLRRAPWGRYVREIPEAPQLGSVEYAFIKAVTDAAFERLNTALRRVA